MNLDTDKELEVPAVTAGDDVVATNWANLLTRNATLASHQGTSITSITNPSTGNTIEAYAASECKHHCNI